MIDWKVDRLPLRRHGPDVLDDALTPAAALTDRAKLQPSDIEPQNRVDELSFHPEDAAGVSQCVLRNIQPASGRDDL